MGAYFVGVYYLTGNDPSGLLGDADVLMIYGGKQTYNSPHS
jgi:hypothetical protein